uniref:Pyrokinin receptor GPCR protein n=1 Tax=Polyphagotarsonemus latus TaxID=1204166 RepID=A0AAN0LI00_9ACAR
MSFWLKKNNCAAISSNYHLFIFHKFTIRRTSILLKYHFFIFTLLFVFNNCLYSYDNLKVPSKYSIKSISNDQNVQSKNKKFSDNSKQVLVKNLALKKYKFENNFNKIDKNSNVNHNLKFSDKKIKRIKRRALNQLNDSNIDKFLNENNDTDFQNYTGLFQNWLKDSIKANDENFENIDTLTTKDSLSMAIFMTILYFVVFLTGVTGNVGTCIVILRNKYMRTATNYYLFSLAVSDLTLLVFGLPQDLYLLWRPYPYIFGEVFCILRGLTCEASSNASILTITAFTIERYLAICYPLKAHTMSKLNRVVKLVFLIWIASALFALPLALQFGIKLEKVELSLPESALCTIKNPIVYSFEISTFFFFVIPLCLLTVLYIKIGIQLRRSEKCITRQNLNTNYHQGNLSPNESLLLATVNAPPSSPSSFNISPNENDSKNIQNSKKYKNFFRIIRRYFNTVFKLNDDKKKNYFKKENVFYLDKIKNKTVDSNSFYNKKITENDESMKKKFDSLNDEIHSLEIEKFNDSNNNFKENKFIVTVEKTDTLECNLKLKNSSQNLEDDKDDFIDSEEKKCMIDQKDINLSKVNDKKIIENIADKKKQLKKMNLFGTSDSTSSNGLNKKNLPFKKNTTLNSQDSNVSLTFKKRNWKFFENRSHSTRTIYHSSSSRRAVVKMLGM